LDRSTKATSRDYTCLLQRFEVLQGGYNCLVLSLADGFHLFCIDCFKNYFEIPL